MWMKYQKKYDRGGGGRGCGDWHTPIFQTPANRPKTFALKSVWSPLVSVVLLYRYSIYSWQNFPSCAWTCNADIFDVSIWLGWKVCRRNYILLLFCKFKRFTSLTVACIHVNRIPVQPIFNMTSKFIQFFLNINVSMNRWRHVSAWRRPMQVLLGAWMEQLAVQLSQFFLYWSLNGNWHHISKPVVC